MLMAVDGLSARRYRGDVSPPLPSKLFNAIVVLGASLVARGCSGDAPGESASDSQTSTSSATGSASASSTTVASTSAATSTAPTSAATTAGSGATGTSTVAETNSTSSSSSTSTSGASTGEPVSPDTCDAPGQLHCDEYEPAPLGCACDPSAPLGPEDCVDPTPNHVCEGTHEGTPIGCDCVGLQPADCEKTADFHCEQWEPEWMDCMCVPGSPESDAECIEQGFEVLYCHDYEPPVGCYCGVLIL